MDHPSIQLAQSHLKLLELCPRKYQYTYLEQLLIPNVSADTEAQEQIGRQFHLLMQQHWMGLNIIPTLQTDPELASRFQAFENNPPAVLQPSHNQDARQCFTEHQRLLQVGNHTLVGVFDLLILSPHSGHILDWKSYIKPSSSSRLEASWQTQLYCYLLAETSPLAPEQISMTYWFAKIQASQDSHTYTFPYSQQQHQNTQRRIEKILHQLNQYLKGDHNHPSFPKTDDESSCHSKDYPCPYRYRCGRDRDQNPISTFELTEIPEIHL